jgi:membrane-bound lytic murein transglycosylase B
VNGACGPRMHRRAVLRGAVATFAVLCGHPLPAAAQKPRSTAEAPAGFADFVRDIWPLAQAQGVRRETFDVAIEGLSYDPATPSGISAQPEFDRPLHVYLAAAVTPQRIAQGRAQAARWRAELAAIEPRYGVPATILLAAWGMETDFGRGMGAKDIVRSLASLAYRRDDRSLFVDEFVAALVMIERGVARANLKGSWAGAMGNPQFLPSAYLKYAVSFSGAGAPDIWASVPDSLASIAHFLRESGWQPGLPWGMEVILPADYDFATLHMAFPGWAALGARPASERALPSKGDSTLFLPSGAGGPAFLLSDNYWVLKAYNNSDSYALSLALLADRLAGGGGARGMWPAQEKILSRTEKTEVQQLLTALGLYRGTIDGRFGPASRDAIHDFQRTAGLHPADGYGSASVLQALRAFKGAPRTPQ